jgi:hypothetical protein
LFFSNFASLLVVEIVLGIRGELVLLLLLWDIEVILSDIHWSVLLATLGFGVVGWEALLSNWMLLMILIIFFFYMVPLMSRHHMLF